MSTQTADPIIRRGSPDDVRACVRIIWEAATDLGTRIGAPLKGSADDWWRTSEPMYRFLAQCAAEWWVAEDPGSRDLIGYARSLRRDGLLELTEFFVRPGQQSRGIGRALLERAFPSGQDDVRAIIATSDVRAFARYYAAGVQARFPILTLAREPQPVETAGTLAPSPVGAGGEAVLAIEAGVLGHARGDDELRWLLSQREGWLYRRDGAAVGYAFVGKHGAGPIAALDPDDLREILLHVESRAAAEGLERLELEVPGPNTVAMRHLLGRGFRADQWINFLMSDRPFGQFDRFIAFSPPIFL